MELKSFFCQFCSEKTIYSAQKPKRCCMCGEPFALFGSATVASKPAPVVKAEEQEEDEEARYSKLRLASHYRNKVKNAQVDEEDLDDENEDEGDDFNGGDKDFSASAPSNQVSIQDFLGNLAPKNKSVSFSSIIKANNSNDSKPAKAKRGRKPGPKGKKAP